MKNICWKLICNLSAPTAPVDNKVQIVECRVLKLSQGNRYYGKCHQVEGQLKNIFKRNHSISYKLLLIVLKIAEKMEMTIKLTINFYRSFIWINNWLTFLHLLSFTNR